MSSPSKGARALLTQLLPDGPAIYVPSEGQTWQLAWADWLVERDRKMLRWCAVFPESQANIHHTIYDKVEVRGQYLLLLDAAGTMVAGVGPAAEFDVPQQDWAVQWATWQSLLAEGDVAERMEHFFRTA